MVLHIFAHTFINIQPIFNPKKVLESYVCMLKHVELVKVYFDLDLLFKVQYFTPSTPLTSKRHSIYTVDSKTNFLNYMKIRLNGLNYFELQQTSK